MSRRAFGTLKIIFGTMILFVIALVFLGMFIRQTSGPVNRDYYNRSDMDLAIEECQNLCDAITDIDGAIEYCTRIQSIDFNNNGSAGAEIAEKGGYQFCENSIPCFLLADCTHKGYGLEGCRNLITEQQPDLLDEFKDPRSEQGCNASQETTWYDQLTGE
ncbi:hypothetical protein GF345_05675 [Candidatus Woesearchaeota archaeon]|nr:hypothetical protein [Candidatus Woesearchaeota archaeon]